MSFTYYEVPTHASAYNEFRPSTPDCLVKKIIKFVQKKCTNLKQAVDVGCGSGQSTSILAPYFKHVIGFDPSEVQITEAQKHNTLPNVIYRVGTAERIECEDSSVELITAAQSCHWFDLPKFYSEAERVLVPGGTLAMYGYLLPQPQCGDYSPELASIVDKYYNDVLGHYVLPESKKVYLEQYKGPDFTQVPFSDGPVIRDESVAFTRRASVSDLVGYVSSWSAYQNCIKQEGEEKAASLLKQFEIEIMKILGAENKRPEDTGIEIRYQYFLLLSRKSKE